MDPLFKRSLRGLGGGVKNLRLDDEGVVELVDPELGSEEVFGCLACSETHFMIGFM